MLVMSYSVKHSISEQGGGNGTTTTTSSNCCSTASSQLKIYQTFIFSVPIFFTFILLFLFYWFYLRRRRADWSSLRMRANNSVLISEIGDDLSRCELGLKKELREMLPIIVFNESFSETRYAQSALGSTKQRIDYNRYRGVGTRFTWTASTSG